MDHRCEASTQTVEEDIIEDHEDTVIEIHFYEMVERMKEDMTEHTVYENTTRLYSI